jgi:hypothetical protein
LAWFQEPQQLQKMVFLKKRTKKLLAFEVRVLADVSDPRRGQKKSRGA